MRPLRLPINAAMFALSCAASAAFAQDAKRKEQEREAAESAEIVVQATRSGRRVGDEPIRVEVIDAEELAEKITMVPGNISMVVAETNGLQVQITAPGLGGANIGAVKSMGQSSFRVAMQIFHVQACSV